MRALLPFVAALGVAGCALLADVPPDTAARESYRAAKKACAAYELAPAALHNEETDRACRSLRLVCE